MELLKKLSIFGRSLEMPLINCEINVLFKYFAQYVISSHTSAYQAISFAITSTKSYVPVVTFSILDHAKLLQQLK